MPFDVTYNQQVITTEPDISAAMTEAVNVLATNPQIDEVIVTGSVAGQGYIATVKRQ